MDVYEIRKQNLLLLEAEHLSLKAIGDAMVRVVQRREPGERAPDYPNVLSQHKGKKPMGARMARLIEEAMGKPNGWMDSLQTVDVAMEAREASQVYMNIPEEHRAAWLSMGRTLAEKNPTRSSGNPFGDVPKGGRKKGGTQ